MWLRLLCTDYHIGQLTILHLIDLKCFKVYSSLEPRILFSNNCIILCYSLSDIRHSEVIIIILNLIELIFARVYPSLEQPTILFDSNCLYIWYGLPDIRHNILNNSNFEFWYGWIFRAQLSPKHHILFHSRLTAIIYFIVQSSPKYTDVYYLLCVKPWSSNISYSTWFIAQNIKLTQSHNHILSYKGSFENLLF